MTTMDSTIAESMKDINMDSTIAGYERQHKHGQYNSNSTIAGSMNDNINMDSTIAGPMKDNINMDSTIAGSMNDNINMNSTIAGPMKDT